MSDDIEKSPLATAIAKCPLCGTDLQYGFLARLHDAEWMKTVKPIALGERFVRGLSNRKNAHACRCLKCGFVAFKIRSWSGPDDSHNLY